MKYKDFRAIFLREVQEFYGENAVVKIEKMTVNNSKHQEGISIRKKDATGNLIPTFHLDSVYQAYQKGTGIEECIKLMNEKVEKCKFSKVEEEFAEKLKDWSYVKERVYPMLLSVKENAELLKSLIFTPMLDLAICYVIRIKTEKGDVGLKVTSLLLDYYEISKEELHRTALNNMERQGYQFQHMSEVLRELCPIGIDKGAEADEDAPPMYVLTNKDKAYGAAGILNRKLLKEFAEGKSFYIIPSSVHETIFIPAIEECESTDLDAMIQGVNQAMVPEGEILSDHSYYYDGKSGDIRMCA